MKKIMMCLAVAAILVSMTSPSVLGWFAAESPGYWKRQVKGEVDDQGHVHENIVALTNTINDDWYGVCPLPDMEENFDEYLCCVEELDTDEDGDFDIDDAYEIFWGPNKKEYKHLWKCLANWYNFVSYRMPYPLED